MDKDVVSGQGVTNCFMSAIINGEAAKIPVKPFVSWRKLMPLTEKAVRMLQDRAPVVPGREGQEYDYDTVYINKFKKTGRARVEDDAALQRSLGEFLYQAHLEIGAAMGLDIDYRMYPHEASFLEKIPGTGSAEEKRRWVLDTLKLFSDWRKALPSTQHYGICYDVCFRGLTMSSCAWERMKDRQTIARKLKKSLEIWCQLRDADKAPKERPPERQGPKGEFKISRVVIYERD